MLRLKSPKMLSNQYPDSMKGSEHVSHYIDTCVKQYNASEKGKISIGDKKKGDDIVVERWRGNKNARCLL